ncbi:PREDICTED: peptidyl-alpha-hydroxyglycine alpha-amidating lyase 1-like [Polistes dominula]|uniref:peptidylamidoglycolate lyase n=1 Tax=Polistes dominula TaxID=743375 RepID=A0ABM1JB68_POLDO|nr:PREDICTED: peptidyl-alpha-hydroxyglycine alpha-amidating lyase 1-like [Polistes dominula]
MMLIRHDILCYFNILFIISAFTGTLSQDLSNDQEKSIHLPDTKFDINEYSEYSDNADRKVGPLAPQWNPTLPSNRNMQLLNVNTIDSEISTQSSEVLDPNIEWDSQWGSDLNLRQISSVSLHPNGNIVLFHRGNRSWDQDTFDNENKFDPNKGPIRQNTILLMDKSGKKLLQWGKNMFYLPHGLTIDFEGNYWITDVALHQVLKFDANDIKACWNELKREQYNTEFVQIDMHDRAALFKHSIIKPSLILGEAFEPGNDKTRFCKPTAVAVQLNGDFFVSDGYCNSRIIKFNKKGEQILQWGRHWGGMNYLQPPPPSAFFLPHALALAHNLDYIFVVDRENGRVSCFFASNGTFHKQYKHSNIGTKIYSAAYAQEKLYLINGPDPVYLNEHIHGSIVDINTGNILSQFAPTQRFLRPHDIAVSNDGSEIYIVDLDTFKIYKFLQKSTASVKTENSTHSSTHHLTAPLTDTNSEELSNSKTTMATLILSLVTTTVILITVCVATAAVIARCQKRGCLLMMRKRMHWEAERRENFKLSNLLEKRRGKGFKFSDKRPNKRDFSKLNTEPETSDEERPEHSLNMMI